MTGETSTPIQVPVAESLKPVSAETAARVVRGERTGGPNSGESGILLAAKDKLGVSVIEVVAGEKVPPGIKDALLLQLFGETDLKKIDPKLLPLATQLDGLINRLTKSVDIKTLNASEVNTAIIDVVLQSEGWAQAYKNMTPFQKTAFIKGIRESGMIPSARRLLIGKTVLPENNEYASSKRIYDEASSTLDARKTERRNIEIKTKLKDRSKIVAERESEQRKYDELKGERVGLLEQIEELQQAMANRSNEHIRSTTGAAESKSVDQLKKDDSEYQGWQSEVNTTKKKLKNKTKDGIDWKIRDLESKIKSHDESLADFTRLDQLTTQIEELSKQAAIAEGTMLTDRSKLIGQLNGLIGSLNGVLPEAAMKALNKWKTGIDEANTQVARDKAEVAAKEGGVLDGASANFILYLNDAKYVKTSKRTSWRLADLISGKKVGVKEINEIELRTDFDALFATGGRGSANFALTQIDNAIKSGSGAGLSPEQLKYLKANPEAKEKLVEQVKGEVFKTISRKAVMHLKLSDEDLTTLSSSDDFAIAFEKGVGDAQKAKDLIEKAAGAKLKGKTTGEFLRKLPKPILWGLLILILGGIFTKGYGIFG